ncbi:UbiA prenyltransferase family protein [Elizabethkingia argenteiflava]|nr:hypothetical protein [Elizabethkingia argenteiflava]
MFCIFFFNLITFIFCVWAIIHKHHPEWLIKWLSILLLGVLYNSSFLYFPIRKIPLIKIFYVALVWALINSWLIMPRLQWDIFFITFCGVSGLILPFDIRDMCHDHIVTFPQIIGIQKTKYLAYFLLLTASIISIFYLPPDFSLPYLTAMLIGSILVYFSSPLNPDLYFSLGVEGVAGLPFLFYLLLKLF